VRRAVLGLLGALRGVLAPVLGPRVVGRCVGCGQPVREDEPRYLYRGGVMHAEPCVESRAAEALRAQRR
jgi:hypothetical protein